MNRAIRSFLKEFVTRLRTENPRFFKVIQFISFIIGGFTSILSALQSTGINLPPVLDSLASINTAIISVVAIILSQLPNKS